MSWVVTVWQMDADGYDDAVFGPFRRRAKAERKAESMRRHITRMERDEREGWQDKDGQRYAADSEMADWWASLDVLVRPLWPGGLSRNDMVSAFCGSLAKEDDDLPMMAA